MISIATTTARCAQKIRPNRMRRLMSLIASRSGSVVDVVEDVREQLDEGRRARHGPDEHEGAPHAHRDVAIAVADQGVNPQERLQGVLEPPVEQGGGRRSRRRGGRIAPWRAMRGDAEVETRRAPTKYRGILVEEAEAHGLWNAERLPQ